jgi:hypothetical protein
MLRLLRIRLKSLFKRRRSGLTVLEIESLLRIDALIKKYDRIHKAQSPQ